MDLIYSTIIFVVLFYILVIKNYIQYYNKSNEDWQELFVNSNDNI